MKKLYLDDMRDPHESFDLMKDVLYLECDWDIVRSYDEFVAYVEKNGVPDLVSFDHDLADEHYHDVDRGIDPKYGSYEEKTGYDAAKWLAEKCYHETRQLPRVLAHTMNPVGRKNIIDHMLWAWRKIDEKINE